jgi:hypothetical protein
MNKINVPSIVNSEKSYRYMIVDIEQKRKISWKSIFLKLLFFPLGLGDRKRSECEKLTGIIAEDIYFRLGDAIYYKEHLESRLKKKLKIIKLTLEMEVLL